MKRGEGKKEEVGGGVGEREIERCGYFIIQTRIRDKLGSDRPRHVGCEFQIMCCVSAFLQLPNTPSYQVSPLYLSLRLIFLSLSHFLFVLQCHSTILFILKVRLGDGSHSVSLNSAAV